MNGQVDIRSGVIFIILSTSPWFPEVMFQNIILLTESHPSVTSEKMASHPREIKVLLLILDQNKSAFNRDSLIFESCVSWYIISTYSVHFDSMSDGEE